MPPVNFVKPRLFISRCIEFAACRWDGEKISNEVVRVLKDYVEFLSVCPEMEIGLSSPRDPLQVIVSRKKKSLLQIKDNRDLTSLIKAFATKFLETHKDLDGFILKSKSPSCGAYSTKLYKSIESSEPVAIGSGLFTEVVQKTFPLLPVIEESDMNDVGLLDFFLTRIFTIAAFRSVEKEQSPETMRRFYEQHQILFEWFNPVINSSMKALFNQAPEYDKEHIFSSFSSYLLLLLQERPTLRKPVEDLYVYPEDLRSLFRI